MNNIIFPYHKKSVKPIIVISSISVFFIAIIAFLAFILSFSDEDYRYEDFQ